MIPPPTASRVQTSQGARKRTRPLRRSLRALVAPVAWDPIRFSLGALMLVSIAGIHRIVPILAVFRPGLLLTAVALGCAVALPKTVNVKDFFATAPARRVRLLLIITLVGAPLGLSLGSSMKFFLETYLPNLVFFGLLVVAVRNAGDLRFLIGSYVTSMLILVYMSIFVWEMRTFGGFNRVNSTVMYDANDLGAIFALGMPLALLLGQTSRGWVRWLSFLTAAGGPAAIALAGSRGGFLSLLATGVTLLIMLPKVTLMRRIQVVAVAATMVALVAPPGYLKQMQTITNPGADYNVTSETGRVEIWKRGLRNLAPRPITGVGLNNFVRAQWERQEFTERGAPIQAMSPHNTFLQVAVDLGVPALFVFLSIVGGGVFGLARIRSRLPVSWLQESPTRRFIYLACSYIPVSYVGWSVGAFFVSHAYLVPFYALTAFTAGVLVLLRHETRGAAHRTPTKGRRFPAPPQATASVATAFHSPPPVPHR